MVSEWLLPKVYLASVDIARFHLVYWRKHNRPAIPVGELTIINRFRPLDIGHFQQSGPTTFSDIILELGDCQER